MKKNLIKTTLLICCCLTINKLNVKAEGLEETLDKTKYSITASVGSSTENEDDVKLNINLNKPADSPTNAKYYTFFTNEENTKPNINASNSGCGIDPDPALGEINQVTDNGIDVSDDWAIVTGYNLAYIIEEVPGENATCKMTSEPISVTKPSLPSLDKMYEIIALSEDKTLNIFPRFPFDKTKSHQMNAKIGVISDSSIINNFINNASGANESLLNYAKNNTGTEFDANLNSDNSSMKANLNTFTISNGTYYFIYTTFGTAADSFQNLEGIALAQGQNGDLIFEFTPTANTNNTTATTATKTATKNPPTGAIPLAVLFIIVLASLGVGIFLVKKQKQQQV